MQIVLIADIHANLVALETVLANIDRTYPDQLICLGDVAANGPQPRQTLDRLRALQCPVVMGNTDARLLSPQPTLPADEDSRRIEEIDQWCVEQLSSDDRDFLRTFQPTVDVALDDDATLLCFHGSPQSYNDIIVSSTPAEELDHFFAGARATVMAGGHTHEQMLRRHRKTIVINPGSVGFPFQIGPEPHQVRNPPWAEYALVSYERGDLSIELKRVPISVEDAVRLARESNMPNVDWWIKGWL